MRLGKWTPNKQPKIILMRQDLKALAKNMSLSIFTPDFILSHFGVNEDRKKRHDYLSTLSYVTFCPKSGVKRL